VQTVVVLGASNITLSLPVIHATIRGSAPAPLRLAVAAGHGRSFGVPSTVLGRTLPSLLECGLWRLLDQGTDCSSPPVAMITDLGNDLLYGSDAARILDWLSECLDRLQVHQTRIAITGLPMGSLDRLTPGRFLFFRRLLFPGSQLTFEAAMREAALLDQGVRALAAERQLIHVEPESAWYGIDPIHIRRRYRPVAMTRFLQPLLESLQPSRPSLPELFRVWNRKADVRWRGQRRFETSQPVLRDAGGELWLY